MDGPSDWRANKYNVRPTRRKISRRRTEYSAVEIESDQSDDKDMESENHTEGRIKEAAGELAQLALLASELDHEPTTTPHSVQTHLENAQIVNTPVARGQYKAPWSNR